MSRVPLQRVLTKTTEPFVVSPSPLRADSPILTPEAPYASVVDKLAATPWEFSFFQAVRLLERLHPDRLPVGYAGPVTDEVVRFRAHMSLAFPPSEIYELIPPKNAQDPPLMTVTFLGLYGPSGILPRHYTEMLLRLHRDLKGDERSALRDWFDLFNHRLIALFYRAWEKYRFYIPYERGEYALAEPDTFTRGLYSLLGLGLPSLRDRLRVAVRVPATHGEEQPQPQTLVRIEDLSLLYYAGLLAQRPRNAEGLQALLADYFQLPVRVEQFRGQWLALDPENQTALGGPEENALLGMTALAGSSVYEVQGRVRLCLGPLHYADFAEFLPDRAPTVAHKSFYLLVHLARLYLGPELDFDVQLLLVGAEAPLSQLAQNGLGTTRLGWNSWLGDVGNKPYVDDAIFEADEVVFVN